MGFDLPKNSIEPARPAADGLRFILLNPAFLILITFIGGYLIWYFGMPERSVLPGVAPRHDSIDAQFRFLIMFLSFAAGLYIGNTRKAHIGTNAHLSDGAWLSLAWGVGAVAILADVLYLRTGAAAAGHLSQNYIYAIRDFANSTRANAQMGVTSLNNLFPIPTGIGAALLLCKRPISKRQRWQAGIILGLMGAMTLLHGVTGLGRIWFLSFLLTCFVMWVTERRPKLRVQLLLLGIGIVVSAAFVFGMELLRNVGLTATSKGMSLADPRILSFAFDVLVQAYAASDVNNALIVLDCHPPVQIVSTLEVISHFTMAAFGTKYVSYSSCPNWTSLFGTFNFLASMWWDWGNAAPVIAASIGFFLQTMYRAGIARSDHLTLAAVLLPNIVFAAMHLTRTMFIASTEFVLPSGFLLAIWMLQRIGRPLRQLENVP